MTELERLLAELDQQVQALDEKSAQARVTIQNASEEQKKAEEEIKKAEEDREKLEVARKKMEEAELKRQEAKSAYREATGESEEETEKEEKKQNKGNKFAIGFISGALAVAILLGVGFAISRESKKGKVLENPKKNFIEDTNSEDENLDNRGLVDYNSSDNTFTINDNIESTTLPLDETSIESLDTEAEKIYITLDTETFNKLVNEYSKKYGTVYEKVNEEDLNRFASIANIDKLSEDNPELIVSLGEGITKEEYINDAGKVIGATVMNNFIVWNETRSTENFVRVSDIIVGEEQQTGMLKIEEYTDRIADAVNENDADKVNEIVAAFITDLNSGELSKLDDGVGFAAQVNIAVISDGIAKDYLNQENFDMFQILKSSEKFVSNIFREYESCEGRSKTLGR